MNQPPVPSFQSRDPSAPDFWTERFEQSFTPWDKGGVPQDLQRFVAQSPRSLRTLIPGCGTGYEVACLTRAGWDVTAIDFSPAAVAAAKRNLGDLADKVVQADFFTFEPPQPPELIYERAFLCALPVRMRGAIAERWAALLPPGGLLTGYFFLDPSEKGPPFGIAQAELDTLLNPCFERLEDRTVSDSLPVFAGRERWQIWRRK